MYSNRGYYKITKDGYKSLTNLPVEIKDINNIINYNSPSIVPFVLR